MKEPRCPPMIHYKTVLRASRDVCYFSILFALHGSDFTWRANPPVLNSYYVTSGLRAKQDVFKNHPAPQQPPLSRHRRAGRRGPPCSAISSTRTARSRRASSSTSAHPASRSRRTSALLRSLTPASCPLRQLLTFALDIFDIQNREPAHSWRRVFRDRLKAAVDVLPDAFRANRTGLARAKFDSGGFSLGDGIASRERFGVALPDHRVRENPKQTPRRPADW